MNKFRERFKELRLAKEDSQKKAAQVLGVSWYTISHYETGYTQPSLDMLIRICAYLETTSDYLLGIKDYE